MKGLTAKNIVTRMNRSISSVKRGLTDSYTEHVRFFGYLEASQDMNEITQHEAGMFLVEFTKSIY